MTAQTRFRSGGRLIRPEPTTSALGILTRRPSPSACGPLENVGWECSGQHAASAPAVQLRTDIFESGSESVDNRLLLGIGPVLDLDPGRPPGLGELPICQPPASLKRCDRCRHLRGVPTAGAGVAQERHPEPKLREDVHLHRPHSGRGGRGDVTVATMLTDQVAGPPKSLRGVGRPPTTAEPTEQRPARTACTRDRLGYEVCELSGVVVAEDLPQASSCRLVTRHDQLLARHDGSRRFIQTGNKTRLEPGKRRRHNKPGRFTQARGTACYV